MTIVGLNGYNIHIAIQEVSMKTRAPGLKATAVKGQEPTS